MKGLGAMDNIYQRIDHYLREDRRVVLSRIIRQSGSSPRSLGTGCVLTDDGELKGTIGGGRLEFEVLEEARKVLQNGKSSLLSFQMTGDEVAASDMICGGSVDVYLEPVFPENEAARTVFRNLAALIEKGRAGRLVTRISQEIDAVDTACRMLVGPEGETTGELDIPAGMKPQLLHPENTGQAILMKSDQTEDAFFMEPVRPGDVLYLFGAGHVSLHVAALAETVGFSVVVIDDRAEFANRRRFPRAGEIMVAPFVSAFDRIRIGASDYIVIVTRGHSHDRDVLRWALTQPAVYVGMIGSRRKRNIIYRSLMDEGVSADRLEAVHSPIGLPIGGQTPAEIAVSIVAELIDVRASQKGPVKDKKGAADG